jgi:hypothetical protein
MGAASAPELAKDGAGRVIPAGGIAYWLSEGLVVTAALSALLTYLVGGVLRGPVVMNGSARGTALVVLVAGVPVLACSLVLARRGSPAAVVTWLAAVGVPAVQRADVRVRDAVEPAVPAVPGHAVAGRPGRPGRYCGIPTPGRSVISSRRGHRCGWPRGTCGL